MDEGTKFASRATRQLSSSIQSEMKDAKGGLLLVEHSVGIHIPRHLNNLLLQIPGVGALFANMLPLIGIAAAITLIVHLIEHHQALKDAMAEAQKAWKEIGEIGVKSSQDTAIKMLELQKTIDDLHHNHLAALKDELQLIDKQTFRELGSQLDALVKKVDEAFTKMEKTMGWTDKLAVFLGAATDQSKQAKQDFDAWSESWKNNGMQADALKKKLDDLNAAK